MFPDPWALMEQSVESGNDADVAIRRNYLMTAPINL